MSRRSHPPRIVVVGAGVAGLATSFEILERAERIAGGVELHCFEAGDLPGGKVRTQRRDGWICEWSASGFLDNVPSTLTLVRRLGLTDRLVTPADDCTDRFVYRAGALRRIPRAPWSLFGSGVLSPLGTLRLLLEPFVPRARDGLDESVWDFVRRRCGREAAAILGQSLVIAICGGDARRLSLRSTFPRIARMERQHGSLLRALAARRRAGEAGRRRPTRHSFRLGMTELIDALAARVGGALHLGTPVHSIGDMGDRGFRVHRAEGAPLDVDAVVVACPSWNAPALVEHADAELAEAIGGIPAVPVVVVHLGFRDAQLGDRPRGFGFLAPRDQGLRVLGCSFSSDIFPGRAPRGMSLFSAMLGGARDPSAIELRDSEAIGSVRTDLAQAVGINADPVFAEVMRHPRAVPQYVIGHDARLEKIEARLAQHPGLFVTGNSYRGFSVNACVEQAGPVAERVLEFVLSR